MLIAVCGGSKPSVARLEVCHAGCARPLWGVTRACGAPMTAGGSEVETPKKTSYTVAACCHGMLMFHGCLENPIFLIFLNISQWIHVWLGFQSGFGPHSAFILGNSTTFSVLSREAKQSCSWHQARHASRMLQDGVGVHWSTMVNPWSTLTKVHPISAVCSIVTSLPYHL